MLLTATICGACIIVILGKTILAIEPAAPRDRAAPSLNASHGPLRITVLGTSLSSASRYRWPDEVGVQLASRTGRRVDVQRLAQAGASSTWGSQQIEQVLRTDPDIVLVEFSVNDADIRHHLTVRASIAQHEDILAGLQASGRKITVVLLTMNPASGPRAWIRPLLSRYYAAYVHLAQRYDAGLVDLYARWLALPVADRELTDGLHPSDATATSVIVDPVVSALSLAAGTR